VAAGRPPCPRWAQSRCQPLRPYLVRSLARYARVSPDAVARHVAESDPAPQVVRQMTRPGIP